MTDDRYRFEIARSPSWIKAYFDLRSAIFCHEQGLFEGHDRDPIDDYAYPIVAIEQAIAQPTNQQVSTPDQVVGVVRIYEPEPGLWYGGRLGTHPDYRKGWRIGKGLIHKAVTTANTWGCDRFLATVQLQNVRFFQRLHWQSLDEMVICDRPHHLMEADLNYYPPGHEVRPVMHPLMHYTQAS